MSKQSPSDIARDIITTAREAGLRITKAGDDVLTVETTFTPGDVAAYLRAESDAYRVLRLLPMTYPGTIWGTDSGSVGGHAGLSGGYCRMSKSGGSKRVLNAVRKLQKEGR